MRAFIALSLLGVALGCFQTAPGPGPDPMTTPNPGPNPGPEPKPMKMKPFLFGVEGAWAPYSFQDSLTGKAVGFLHDVVKAACDGCGRECDLTFIGTSLDRCYNPESMSGDGLNDRHFDACVGWTATIPRWNVFNFSVPMLTAQSAQMYVMEGSEVTADNIQGSSYKIGFRRYWYMDKFCIRRNGLDVADENVVEIEAMDDDGWMDVAMALENGQIDAAVMPDGHPIAMAKNLVPLGIAVSCNFGGEIGLMHRKDVDTMWFDSCVAQMQYTSNAWYDLCSKWQVPNCIDPYA
ncbi:unnamed protein product [Owenia fusiformis]|uniref:Solute-binding protein family 3/N-terminal domain-containing protein n=1 Tax=Owenia fusiformis TaxID=6347 RepID=A0A8J1UI56_OWEFU|nr:unnamed protein product [Owenia fusiformis]